MIYYLAYDAMFHANHSILINRSIEDVYRFVALDFFDNYPKWSPEVLELEQLTAGAMRVGVTGRQVRLDSGYRNQARFRVSSLVALRELRFSGISRPHFEVCYRFESVAAATRLTFDFRLEPTLVMLPFRNRIRSLIEQGGERVVGNLQSLLEANTDGLISGTAPETTSG